MDLTKAQSNNLTQATKEAEVLFGVSEKCSGLT